MALFTNPTSDTLTWVKNSSSSSFTNLGKGGVIQIMPRVEEELLRPVTYGPCTPPPLSLPFLNNKNNNNNNNNNVT